MTAFTTLTTDCCYGGETFTLEKYEDGRARLVWGDDDAVWLDEEQAEQAELAVHCDNVGALAQMLNGDCLPF